MAVRFQLVIDCADPEPLARFWAAALGYELEPPPDGFASWDAYRRDLGVPEDELGTGAGCIVDPGGRGPRIWFQVVPERKAAKNRPESTAILISLWTQRICLLASRFLSDLGHGPETDWLPVRIELAAAGARWVDVHPVRFAEGGRGRQAGPGGAHFDYPPCAFTSGSIARRRVNCLSAEQQRQFRTGYDLRPQDIHDLAELDAVQRGSQGQDRSC